MPNRRMRTRMYGGVTGKTREGHTYVNFGGRLPPRGKRQRDREPAPPAGEVLGGESAPVALEDGIAHRQAQPHVLSLRLLGGVEGEKHVVRVRRGDARAVVFHAHERRGHPVHDGLLGCDRDRPAVRRWPRIRSS